MLSDFLELFGPTVSALELVFNFWWIWLAPVSVTILIAVLLPWRQNLYKREIEWIVLELRMPREVEKTPRAMEQFLSVLHGLFNAPGDRIEKFWDGQVTLWHSLEIVSIQGEIHFYMRSPKKFQKIIEANLYAAYPTLEVHEVPDYVEMFPPSYAHLKNQGYGVWGAELILDKSDAYPIRTYVQFENIEESLALDPIAALLEILSRVSPGENMLIQILIRPTKDEWKKTGEKIVEELRNKGVKPAVGPAEQRPDRPVRTPGETEVLKAIEFSLTKPGFETLIRFVYVAHESKFTPDFARRGVTSAFNQYADQSLNSFKRNPAITTDTKWTYFPYFFPDMRVEARKQRIYSAFRRRMLPEQTVAGKYLTAHILHANFGQRTFVLNTEEIATLYHPPTQLVLTGPLMERVTSKKMGPPSGLPIFEEPKENI